MLRMRRLLSSVASRSAMSFSSASVSAVRLRMYSRLMLRSLISATKFACTSSRPKPAMRLGTTSASRSVLRMMAMARSMSSRILPRPCSRCSLARFFCRSKNTRRRMHSMRHDVHSSRISPTPITRGLPAMRMLKLQAKLSHSGVSRKSFCMTCSGSAPRLRSMASFRPLRSVSSRISATSRSLPALTSSATLSMTASTVVEYGIS